MPNDIVSEINRLIDLQVDTLRGRATREDVVEYFERKRRILELVERLYGSAQANTSCVSPDVKPATEPRRGVSLFPAL